MEYRLREGPRNASWIGHDVQNELISVLASSVREVISKEIIEAQYFCIIADETKDISKEEQLSIIVRYFLNGTICEKFICYTHASKLDATSLCQYILSTLTSMQVDIQNCVAQCYDRASVMSGSCSGVSTQISSINHRAIYVHCYVHRLT